MSTRRSRPRPTGPALLAVHDEIIAMHLSPRVQAGEIGPGIGLGGALTPEGENSKSMTLPPNRSAIQRYGQQAHQTMQN
jgi:hypothetical protein